MSDIGSRNDYVSTSFDILQPTTPPTTLSPPPDTTTSTAPQQPPAAPAPQPPQGQTVTRPKPAWLNRRTLMFIVAATIVVGGAVILWRALASGSQLNSSDKSHTASQFGPLEVPLGEIAESGQLSLDPTRSLNINGQLRANNGFVISPTTRPAAGVAGQMYYDSATNELNYYNGTGFVSLTTNPQTVTSINGTTGSFTLGGGLSLNGTQLTNSGVISVTSASANLTINDDGNGNITLSDTPGQFTGVQSAGGTAGRIAVFTGAGTIANSLISQTATDIAVNGGMSIAGTLNLNAGDTSTINIASTSNGVVGQIYNDGNLHLSGGSNNIWLDAGGTGTIFLNSANGNPVAINQSTIPSYPLEVNGDINITTGHSYRIGGTVICSISGCSGGGGGGGVSSLNTLSGDLTLANASAAGSTITINDASTSQKGIAQFDSTNFTTAAGMVNTIQDIHTAAAPTFGQLTLTSSQASAAMLTVNNTNTSATGNLIDLKLNGATRFSVNPAGNLVVSGTINGQTISSTASLTGTLSVATNITAGGALNGNSAGITTNATVGGNLTVSGTINASTIAPSSALSVGTTTLAFTLQGNASSTITATGGGFTTTVGFAGTPTGAVTYNFDRSVAAGTYSICTTVGNCAGVGGGVTSSGGTTNRVAKFTAGQAIGDSIITDNGSTVTIGGTLSVNTITPTGALVIGSTGQNLTLQGATTQLNSTSGGITNSLVFATPATSNKTITLPNATGTVVVSASGPLSVDANGNVSCPSCVTSGGGGGGVGAVDSLNGLTGALTISNASAGSGTITINDASTSQKGIAQFNSTNFSASGGVINTIQNIHTSAAPTFGQLTLTSSQATAAMLTVNNTNASATGNLIDLRLNGTSRFSVNPAGDLALSGTVNGQTISSTASFTGTLSVATNITAGGSLNGNTATVTSDASVGGNLTVSGIINANTITPSSALTVGATSLAFTLQGSATSKITATGGGFTTTVGFSGTPTGAVTYNFDRSASAGTYTICTTVGNCAGTGGGVTTFGGTTNALAKFTAGQVIGDSIITDNGTTVTIGGTLSVNTITPTGALVVGSTGQNLTLQGATTQLNSTSGGVTNSLVFATPATSNKTITIPNATGTVAVSASGPLSVDASGNISCPSCVTSGGGGGGVGAVDSLNGLTGALTINNATAGSGTITINDASTSQKGIAQFNSTNFSASSGVINTIQNIDTAAAPTFGQLSLSSAQATAAMLTVNNTNASGTGNLIDLKLNGTSRFSVGPQGNVTASGTVNGQTISSTASFTGTIGAVGNITTSASLIANAASITTNINVGGTTTTDALSVTNNASVGGNLTLTGTLTANTITPSSALTVGSTSQNLTLQGATVNLTATSGGITNTLTFATPATSNKTITLPNASGTVCLDSGNCLGGGSGGANTALSNLTGVAINTSLLPGSAGTINLGSATFPFGLLFIAGTSGTPGTNNFRITGASTSGTRVITLPDATGTVCLQSSSSCGFATGSGQAFVQGGNSFTAIAALGTNDAFDFNLQTAGVTRVTIASNGSSVTLASNTDLTLQGTTAYISNTQTRTASEAFGNNASVTGSNAFAGGNGASAAADGVAVGTGAIAASNGVVIGHSAGTGGAAGSLGGPVSVGDGANAGDWGVAVGQNTSNTGGEGTAVGNGATSGQYAVALGSGANAVFQGIAIGRNAATGGNNQIAIGVGATTTADNQLVVGGSAATSSYISDAYFGSGVTDTSPQGFTLHATGGSGSNVAGGALTLAAGRSTGSANGGAVNLQISAPGTAGSTLNTLTTVASLSGADGSALFRNAANSTTAFRVQNAAGSTTALNVDTTNNRVTIGGELILNTVSGGGLTDCDASNSKLLWDATAKQFSCGTDRASVTVRKSADELVTSSTTLQNDDELTFSIGANETYIVHITVNATMAGAGGIKYAVNAPSGATCNVSSLGADGGGTFAEIMNGACGTTGTYAGGGTSSLSSIDATIVNGATPGSVSLQWAQGSSNGTATRVKAGSSLVAYKASGADLAEAYYTTDRSIISGDVVALDPASPAGVTKASTPYDTKAIGVISTQPGEILANPDAGKAVGRPVLVALSGRIPVKVSTQNGEIQAGDFLTASPTPGVAMKATRPGQVIGRALESYAGNTQGLVLMFASQQWADPRDPDGDQLQSDMLQSSYVEANTLATDAATIKSLTVSDNADFKGDLVVHGHTTVASLTVNGHIVTGGDTPTIKPEAAVCGGATATVDGTDTTGLITVTTPAGCDQSGAIATLTFSKPFSQAPRVTLTPANAEASAQKTYVDSGAVKSTSFTLATPTAMDGSKTYRWYYQVLQ